MNKSLFEEVLRAVGRVTGRDEVVIIGSQSIHAITDAAPAEVIMSVECDLLLDDEDPATAEVDEALGPNSPFVTEHDVYVDTVSASFPFLPSGWDTRLRTLDVGTLRARCLEIHDLALSKLAAGRLKDFELIVVLLDRGMLELETTYARIRDVGDLHMRAILLARLQIVLESRGR